MNYYISDMHLGHKNVLQYDGRPFEDVEEMDRMLIENWNARVTDNDDVWILGDFCYRSDKDPSFYLKKLKGKKHLIIGNHDKATMQSASAKNYLESIENLQYIKDGEHYVVLCHFPIVDWYAKRKGAYHVHGHVHNHRNDEFEYLRKQERALNAGCMINYYTPMTLKELIINNKRFKEEI